jgi:hypothetical protein
MSSFDAVNYAIRPNKTVERKIVFSGLVKLSHVFDLASYRYVGLGSLWFIDFLMAHKLLGIHSMLSIEASKIGYARSQFNCPLSCIKVIPAETSLAIPELGLEQRPSIVWFDYDSSIVGPAITDIGLIMPRCAPNSIVIVSINAKRDELPDKDENGSSLDSEKSLRRIAGDLVPTPLPPKRLNRQEYPKLLCDILSTKFYSATANSGRPESFIKLFDLVYSDSTPMSTVGGIVVTPEKLDDIRGLVASAGWEGILAEPISIPPLTVKEKLALDRTMPSASPPTDSQMNEIGFQLKRKQIDAYHRHYLHYPMFGEFI